jgi:AraC-like DNA-binding protein
MDIALRAAGASLLLLTASVLVLGAPRSPIARAFLPLALGIAGFLGVNTAFDAAELPGLLWSLASFCSRMAAVFLWLFCLVLFDGHLRAPRAAIAVVAAWLVLVVVDRGYFAPTPAELDVSAIQIMIGTGLVLHAGWRVLRDLRDDLVESRRRARPVFALALLALLAMDFGVDVLHGTAWQPASFLVLQNAAIVVLAAAIGLWLLRAEPWLVATPAAAAGPAGGAPADPDADVVARIELLMRAERPYLDPELTIAAFARRVGLPEPVLRRAINHRLGHGHFRAFLNGYRVEEARRRLRDPAHAGDKILAIALDSGFASLASFNRVFRQVAGCAPSDYRAGSGRPRGDAQ